MRDTALKMYKHGGWYAFTRGLGATIMRDSVFTIIYKSITTYTNQHYENVYMKWGVNTMVIGGVTVFSSPFNYIRNQKYSAGIKNPNPHFYPVLKDLYDKGYQVENPTRWNRYKYYSHRLCIGWGTTRVAIGITFGQELYNFLCKNLTV